MAADGELSPRHAEAVREHLMSCWACRARVNQIEAAISDFVRVRQSELDPDLPPAAGPRALLRARMAALAAESQMSFGAWLLGLRARRPYWFALAALLSALALVLTIRLGSLLNPGMHLEAAAVPKPQLTPGATVPVTKQQVCNGGSLPEGPVVPAPLQQQVFRAYGISNPRPDAYEIDYLITPDLGGTANIRNLWPQPYSNVWNARVKDQLEERLHAMVCNGQLDLATAQHDLATDWVGAYKKYFRTDRPRSGHPKARNGVRRFDLPEDNPKLQERWQLAATESGALLVRRLPMARASALNRAASLLIN